MKMLLDNWLRYLFVKCLCAFRIPARILPIIMLPLALLRAGTSLRSWPQLLRYRDITGCPDNKIFFLFNYFFRRSTEPILGMMICEKPEKFLPQIRITGGEHVTKLKDSAHGVLVIGNHGGPQLLQSFLFAQVFGVPLGSYTDRFNRWARERPALTACERIFKSQPCYRTGQEKALLKGLLSGVWVNMLLDSPLQQQLLNNCRLLGSDVALSQFPFRISLQYAVPLLFVGIERSAESGRILVTIEPIENFDNPLEGLSLYVEKLEKILRTDPYGNSHVPKWIAGK